MTSPTQLTLDRLRENGWHPEVVEKHIPRTVLRKDLWGWCDVLAIRENEVLAVQCTSWSNVAARVRKITISPLLDIVRSAGVAVEVWGWKKNRDGEHVVRKVDLS